jgi:hypothetical protein
LQKGQQQEEAPLDLGVTDDEYLTNPVKASAKITSKIVESYFAKERQGREKDKAVQYVASARTGFEQGKMAATKANPNLYRGIEHLVESSILSQVQESYKAGNPIDPEALRNQEFWDLAAIAHRYTNGEPLKVILSKYFADRHNPMAPVHQETPTASGPPKAEMTLSPEQEELISKGHITREQFMEAWKKERGITEGRNR